MDKRIPVTVGPRIVEMCDEVSVRRYLDAPNAKVIRQRKTGAIVQVTVEALSDDSNQRSTAGGRTLTYEETLDQGKLVVLKRFDDAVGAFVRWTDQDGFNPWRFNPEKLRPLMAAQA